MVLVPARILQSPPKYLAKVPVTADRAPEARARVTRRVYPECKSS
jgi:hypothetical protein